MINLTASVLMPAGSDTAQEIFPTEVADVAQS
jgi:hypothetical protein